MSDAIAIAALGVAVASAGFSAFQWRTGRDTSRTAEMQRLEANAADIVVSIEGWEWPPARPSGYLGPDSSHMEGQKVSAPYNVFRKKGEFSHQLEIVGRLLVRNYSDVAASISFDGSFFKVNRHDYLVPLVAGQTIRVGPREEDQIVFIDCRSVRDWMTSPGAIHGTIRYDDGFDVGVEDWWRVEFQGCPVRQIEDEVGAVEVPMNLPLDGTTPVVLAISRRHHDYYRSKANGRMLK